MLVLTAVQLYRHRNVDPDLEDNLLVRLTRRVLPVSNEHIGGKLVARLRGRRVVTPLFVAIVAIGSADILFALDSIPAVFGITQEPYIVFAANAFALLGLRALFSWSRACSTGWSTSPPGSRWSSPSSASSWSCTGLTA